MQEFPAILEAFYIKQGSAWRAPRVNETCCARPRLADFLELVAAEGPGPVIQHHAAVRLWLAAAPCQLNTVTQKEPFPSGYENRLLCIAEAGQSPGAGSCRKARTCHPASRCCVCVCDLLPAYRLCSCGTSQSLAHTYHVIPAHSL